jgi:pimeloyl-ACP methyl ester carboxylesterase
MQGFSIDPDEASLSVPATVTLPYNPANFGTTDGIPLEGFLGVYFLQTSTGSLQFLNTYSINTTNHILTASLPHFSGWIMANAARICPPTGEPGCPSSYSPTSQSLLPPAVMVHGFQLPGLGDESTWGNLRTLLGQIDSGNVGRIDAWRFDWDSKSMRFEDSAPFLGQALLQVEAAQKSPPPTGVNVVAHSFGGILVRTYLEALSGPPYGVNGLMTLGTPHTGIGGNLSTWEANFCANQARFDDLDWPTCFEVATGQCPLHGGTTGECPPGEFQLTGEGKFLLNLNTHSLPNLQGSASPSYEHIKGKRLFGTTLALDDGLITLAGAQLCSKSPFNVCTGADVQEDEIPGLCHSPTLLGNTCAITDNVAMAQVNNTSHPLWQQICQFLGCGPAINVTVSNPTGGTVKSDVGGINCGATCSAVYAGSPTTTSPTIVTLTATPASGYTFSGWSGSGASAGSCTTQLTCQITIGNDYQTLTGSLFKGYPVTATFVSNANTCPAQSICGSVLDEETGTVKLVGIVIELRDGNGNVIQTRVTDGSGNYTFSNSAIASYYVDVAVLSGEVSNPLRIKTIPGSQANFTVSFVPALLTITSPANAFVLLTGQEYTGPIPCHGAGCPYSISGTAPGPISVPAGTLWLTCYILPSYIQTPSNKVQFLAQAKLSMPCPQ